MQQKLKAVFRSSSRKKSRNTEEPARHSGATPPRSPATSQRGASVEVPRRPQTSDAYTGSAQQNGHSRGVSSDYDSPRMSSAGKAEPTVTDRAQSQSTQSARDSIISDYKAYMPALSPIDDPRDDQHATLGGDRRLITGESELPHEEDVADRNIERYGSSPDVVKKTSVPVTPVRDAQSQDVQVDNDKRGSVGSAPSTVMSTATGATGKYSLGQDIATRGGLVDRILPHTEATAHEKNQWKNKDWPSKTARIEPQVASSRRNLQGSESEDGEPCAPPGDLPSNSQSTQNGTVVAGYGREDAAREMEQLLDGVVDLRNTVDEDKEVQWAPAVTHEVVKPHEHEIIQHKIFREIHNYEYYHHVQPVYDIEVLPPRHWRPNPNGEGLIEISADDIPMRTGINRRWKIVQEQTEIPAESMPKWRTEPEIIEHPTTTTDEGFERRETTIIYPPTIQDMSEYDGPVQPVHFDHKTGKRWVGEITTMKKLRHELAQLENPDMSLKELKDNLPDVPEAHDVPELSHSPELKRKPLNGPVPAQLGKLDRQERIAVAA